MNRGRGMRRCRAWSPRSPMAHGWQSRVSGRLDFLELGAIAQLGERLHGMQEVAGSIPASSTILTKVEPAQSPRGLGRRRP